MPYIDRNHICRARILGLALALFVARSSVGQEVNAAIPQPPIIPPSPINSTYVIRDSVSGVITIYLHEEDGQLTMDETTKAFGTVSDSMRYEKVNYAGVEEDSRLLDAKKTVVRIGASDGTWLIFTLRTETEARTIADYVGRKCSLEFFGGAWRVRRPFQCPNGVGPSACQSFKELLDHDDLEIVQFYYSFARDEHRYVCLTDEPINPWDKARFFLIRYSNYTHFGVFYQEAFEDGQSVDGNFGDIKWVGDSGEISSNRNKGRKPQQLGTVDASSLLYQTKFTNRMGTSTEYRLSIRLSTGRYTESRSGKDDKGKPFYVDAAGTCIKLN